MSEESNIVYIESFAGLFERLFQSTCSISGLDLEIPYEALPQYFETIDAHLNDQGIDKDDCIALECQNSLTAIIVLFSLLNRGQHLLLLPPQGDPLKPVNFQPDIPVFCKSAISVSGSTFTPENIINLINIYPNHLYDQAALKKLHTHGGRLLLLRTSGSMGDAKIVQFSQAKLLGNAGNCVTRFGLRSDSRITIAVPVYHQYGLGAGLVPSLLAGASVNIQENTNILKFMAHNRSFKPDIVYLNPTLITMLLTGRRGDQHYTRTITASAALPEKLYQDYQARFGPLINLYGSTEMGAAATTLSEHTGNTPNRLMPMPSVKMLIDERSNALSCQHPYGFDGYINAQGEVIPVTTCPYNTGDVARTLDDGRIELLGRQDDSTNRSGHLVHFADIENALLKTEQIEAAVVLCSQQEDIRGHKLIAFCTPAKGHDSCAISSRSIREACFEQLPKYAVPDEIILKAHFPLAPSGKINRRLLQQQLSETQEV